MHSRRAVSRTNGKRVEFLGAHAPRSSTARCISLPWPRDAIRRRTAAVAVTVARISQKRLCGAPVVDPRVPAPWSLPDSVTESTGRPGCAFHGSPVGHAGAGGPQALPSVWVTNTGEDAAEGETSAESGRSRHHGPGELKNEGLRGERSRTDVGVAVDGGVARPRQAERGHSRRGRGDCRRTDRSKQHCPHPTSPQPRRSHSMQTEELPPSSRMLWEGGSFSGKETHLTPRACAWQDPAARLPGAPPGRYPSGLSGVICRDCTAPFFFFILSFLKPLKLYSQLLVFLNIKARQLSWSAGWLKHQTIFSKL